MLHACIRKFDVIDIVEKFSPTKQGLNIHWALARTSVHHGAQLTAHSLAHIIFWGSLSCLISALSWPSPEEERSVMRTLVANTLQAYVPPRPTHTTCTCDTPKPNCRCYLSARVGGAELSAMSYGAELGATSAPPQHSHKYLGAMNHGAKMSYPGTTICGTDPKGPKTQIVSKRA